MTDEKNPTRFEKSAESRANATRGALKAYGWNRSHVLVRSTPAAASVGIVDPMIPKSAVVERLEHFGQTNAKSLVVLEPMDSSGSPRRWWSGLRERSAKLIKLYGAGGPHENTHAKIGPFLIAWDGGRAEWFICLQPGETAGGRWAHGSFNPRVAVSNRAMLLELTECWAEWWFQKVGGGQPIGYGKETRRQAFRALLDEFRMGTDDDQEKAKAEQADGTGVQGEKNTRRANQAKHRLERALRTHFAKMEGFEYTIEMTSSDFGWACPSPNKGDYYARPMAGGFRIIESGPAPGYGSTLHQAETTEELAEFWAGVLLDELVDRFATTENLAVAARLGCYAADVEEWNESSPQAVVAPRKTDRPLTLLPFEVVSVASSRYFYCKRQGADPLTGVELAVSDMVAPEDAAETASLIREHGGAWDFDEAVIPLVLYALRNIADSAEFTAVDRNPSTVSEELEALHLEQDELNEFSSLMEQGRFDEARELIREDWPNAGGIRSALTRLGELQAVTREALESLGDKRSDASRVAQILGKPVPVEDELDEDVRRGIEKIGQAILDSADGPADLTEEETTEGGSDE